MRKTSNFTVELCVNGFIAQVTADTGAAVSVCGKYEATKWNLIDKMIPTSIKIKPYNSPPVSVLGKSRCAVTVGTISIPVEWYILEGKCEPILSGSAAIHLGIITFNSKPEIFKPINHINTNLDKNQSEALQNVLAKYPETFNSKLGKHNNYSVKFHIDKSVRPVVTPARPTPYHLIERVERTLQEMIANDVIEEHPPTEAAPWVSAPVIVPKPDGSLRVTLDARNINKALISSNRPIPRQEDIKANLSDSEIFSKLDFTSAFWQLELHPESRSLTVFNINNKLYRYKRLTMGVKPAQGELNAALSPIFQHIQDAHLIHDDVIVGSKDIKSHLKTLEECFSAVRSAGLTLNKAKCQFGKDEIKFWGLIINKHGVKPDPEKVDALSYIEAPKTKEELLSFLCMMQSNAEFIPSFAQKSSTLRELLTDKKRFKWESRHQLCFEELLNNFRKDTLLRFFDITKPIFIFTDAHITGVGAILAQGETLEEAKPVAIASRTTTSAEKKYPQIDLEGLGVDYALMRFRNYLIGAPNIITVVTDHMPLCSVFNGNKLGSIRTERYKMRNQDIKFTVVYQKGKKNQADFLSRSAVPINKRGKEEMESSESINNLLYTLHITPIIDKITLKAISEETNTDPILKELKNIVISNQQWIPNSSDKKLLRFKNILSEITITGNGILLKGERIILPESLQQKALQLCHLGSHPGECSMERRLRYHFYFHDMNSKVKQFIENCESCTLFSDKKCKEPLKAHNVPSKCWEKVSVDLFGPLPSKRHVLVVQDMASRYPVAKIVSSTSADRVLPTLGDIYDTYGDPYKQLSDNWPPFGLAPQQCGSDVHSRLGPCSLLPCFLVPHPIVLASWGGRAVRRCHPAAAAPSPSSLP